MACRAAIIDRQRGNEQPSFRAYIDFQALKSNLSCHIQNVRNRNSDASPEKVVHLYEQWTHLLGEVEQLRAERNANAKSMKVRSASFNSKSAHQREALLQRPVLTVGTLPDHRGKWKRQPGLG
jgi:hypothetical protein